MKHNQTQQRDMWGLITARLLITGEGHAATGSKITALPIEVKDHDYSLDNGEVKGIVNGAQEITLGKGTRNALLRVLFMGDRFKVAFDPKEDKTSDGPSKTPGTEIMVLMKVFSSMTNPKSLDERTQVLSWATMDSYTKARAAAEERNKDIPDLKKEIEKQARTLWRLESEKLGLTSAWATPEKIKESLEQINGGMVPTDAKWFKKSIDLAQKIVTARQKNMDVSKLMEQMSIGERSETAPTQIELLRVGDLDRSLRRVHGVEIQQKPATFQMPANVVSALDQFTVANAPASPAPAPMEEKPAGKKVAKKKPAKKVA